MLSEILINLVCLTACIMLAIGTCILITIMIDYWYCKHGKCPKCKGKIETRELADYSTEYTCNACGFKEIF